jgi:hypothetical protein
VEPPAGRNALNGHGADTASAASDAVPAPDAEPASRPVDGSGAERAKSAAGLDLDELLAELAAAASATLVARRAASAAQTTAAAETGPPAAPSVTAESQPRAETVAQVDAKATEAPVEAPTSPDPGSANASDASAETDAGASHTRRLPIAAFLLKR